MSSVARVRSAFHEVLRDGWSNVLVDLSDVGFVDSAGLGVLIGLQRRCREAGGSCVLVAASDDVGRLVVASGLEGVLPMSASVERAVVEVGSLAVGADGGVG